MTTYTEILNAALALPTDQRGELVETLLESVNHDETPTARPQLSEAWQKELARRSAEIDNGTAKYVTYEQMIARARRAAGHNG
jgi:putative addiction module component (TIGR02574 family)